MLDYERSLKFVRAGGGNKNKIKIGRGKTFYIYWITNEAFNLLGQEDEIKIKCTV